MTHGQTHKQRRSSGSITVGGIAFLATLLGAFVRGFYVLQSDFPLNDGGMFYTMVQDLQAALYHLPLVTSYNQANIPFAYPPLPFYVTGILNSWLHIDLIQLLRILPLLFSIATIPSFYWLAKQVLKTDGQIGAATIIFALFSQTYTWQIMGGGLSRSPAFFFTVLALAAFFGWLKNRRMISFIGIMLFTSLTALCHLEMLLMLGLSFPVIFFFKQHSWKTFWQLLLAGIGTLILTAPWWATIIAHHGISPFVQAISVAHLNPLMTLATLLSLTPTQDLNETVFTILGLLGAAFLISRRDWLIVVWWLVFIFLDPRSIQRSVTIPVAMLAGVSLEQGLIWLNKNLPVMKKERDRPIDNGFGYHKSSITVFIVISLIFLLTNDLVGKYLPGSLLSSLNLENRQAMQWVKENTPKESRFLVIGYPAGWHLDLVGEWFWALGGRVSLLTAQGLEWMPNNTQEITISTLARVSACRMNGLPCLSEWIKDQSVKVNYVYFTQNKQVIDTAMNYTSVVEAQMLTNPRYHLVYSNGDVRIFQMLNEE